MKIQAQDLTSQNLGQVIVLDNGQTFGELSMVSFKDTVPGEVELTLGGSRRVIVSTTELVEVYRNTVNAHQVRKEREAEEVGGILSGGDLDEIEKIVRDMLSIHASSNVTASA